MGIEICCSEQQVLLICKESVRKIFENCKKKKKKTGKRPNYAALREELQQACDGRGQRLLTF